MNAVAITPEPTGPLSQLQQQQVADAHARAQKIRKAAGVAKFNGWTTGILAACSAPFAFFSLSGFLFTVGMSFVAYNELQGRRRLLQFDAQAATFLGWNQVGFLIFITCYCCWMVISGLSGESPFAAEFRAKPELRAAFDSVDQFDHYYRVLVVAFYGMVLLLSVVFQGANAIYYFTRRRCVEAYQQATPDWVSGLQRLSLAD